MLIGEYDDNEEMCDEDTFLEREICSVDYTIELLKKVLDDSINEVNYMNVYLCCPKYLKENVIDAVVENMTNMKLGDNHKIYLLGYDSRHIRVFVLDKRFLDNGELYCTFSEADLTELALDNQEIIDGDILTRIDDSQTITLLMSYIKRLLNDKENAFEVRQLIESRKIEKCVFTKSM